MAKAKKYVYHFGKNKTDGNGTMKALLGGKGANLAEITGACVTYVHGVMITTGSCSRMYTGEMTICRAPIPDI